MWKKVKNGVQNAAGRLKVKARPATMIVATPD
jgi:hypothetical protein